VTARLSVGVQDDRSLQAAVLAFRLAGRDLKRRINTSTKDVFDPVWKSEVRSRAKTGLEQRVLVPGTRVATGNPPTFVAGASRRKLKGGLVPDTDWAPVEFGTRKHGKFRTYTTHSSRGKAYRVSRRTAQQLPARRRHGPVYSALEPMIHRVPSLWAQIVYKIYNDAARGE
jgi:hypothetical protein